MNGGIYSTGNEIVDENAKLNISGNIIPQVWYRTIIRESGKPNLTAIIILADIVYWYKPTEIRDEGTGQVIGVRKKFKSDLLQRSYQQISEQFGISKKEATNAVVFLEKLGVVKRVFRTISMNGIVVNNVLRTEFSEGKGSRSAQILNIVITILQHCSQWQFCKIVPWQKALTCQITIWIEFIFLLIATLIRTQQ